ncbi:MBL fold metallo-hydrolase [Nocardia sp. NPDC051832]|uniref:MBL fold metallo-hydrolase n=1 Tax=Nocardia sp. NPDC051832 TaxID=3155673 RepID=UPI0034485533
MLGGALIDGRSRGIRAPLTCHVLAIEDDAGDITLIDTGLGEQALSRPKDWFGRGWMTVFGPEPDPALTVHAQLLGKGLDPAQVRNIVLTHMDLDHVGGLADFPRATVYVNRRELDGQLNPRSAGDRNRYRSIQFAHDPNWHVFDLVQSDRERWFGFRTAGELPGLPSGLRVVDLGGHSNGHVGVAIDRGQDRWLLHAGDAYYTAEQMDPEQPRRAVGIACFEAFASVDAGLRIETQTQLRELKRDHGDRLQIFCAHSVAELQAFAQPTVPATLT